VSQSQPFVIWIMTPGVFPGSSPLSPRSHRGEARQCFQKNTHRYACLSGESSPVTTIGLVSVSIETQRRGQGSLGWERGGGGDERFLVRCAYFHYQWKSSLSQCRPRQTGWTRRWRNYTACLCGGQPSRSAGKGYQGKHTSRLIQVSRAFARQLTGYHYPPRHH
jgi:hypothetical protein